MNNNLIDEYIKLEYNFLDTIEKYAYATKLIDKHIKRFYFTDVKDIEKYINEILEIGAKLFKYNIDIILKEILKLNNNQIKYYKTYLKINKDRRFKKIEKLSIKDMGCYYDNSYVRELKVNQQKLKSITSLITKTNPLEIAFERYYHLNDSREKLNNDTFLNAIELKFRFLGFEIDLKKLFRYFKSKWK